MRREEDDTNFITAHTHTKSTRNIGETKITNGVHEAKQNQFEVSVISFNSTTNINTTPNSSCCGCHGQPIVSRPLLPTGKLSALIQKEAKKQMWKTSLKQVISVTKKNITTLHSIRVACQFGVNHGRRQYTQTSRLPRIRFDGTK